MNIRRSLLTLALIARDEAKNLPACLDSVEGLCSEIVVVDTGSTDETATIAAAHGAHVFYHRWDDDFAAARNAVLAVATGDWLLVLDADERLHRRSHDAIRTFIGRDDVDAGFLRLHHASRLHTSTADILAGAARIGPPLLLPRLLRRTPDLRWRGRVHEHVGEWLRTRDDRVAPVDADIVHLGAVPEVRQHHGKDDRNFRLLELMHADDPDDVGTAGYLAHHLLQVGRASDARVVAARGWASWEALAADDPEAGAPVGLVTAHAQLLLAAGEVDAALRVTSRAAERCGGHPNLLLLHGHALELRAQSRRDPDARRSDLLAALRCLAVLPGWGDRPVLAEAVDGATTWLSRLRLGSVLLQLGDPEPAAEALAEVVAGHPDEDEAVLLLAEARLASGDAAGAEAVLRSVRHRRFAEAGALAACAADLRGDEAVARALAEEVVAQLPVGFFAPRRLRLLDALLRADEPDEPRYVFIGGAGRSGTTLLRAMLHAHPNLHAGPELKLVVEFARSREAWPRVFREALAANEVDSSLLDRATRAFLRELLDGLPRTAARVVEKTPHNIVHVETLARLFPRARFVHVVRDPRAVVASLLRQRWVDPASGEALPYTQNAAAAAAYWLEVVGAARAGAMTALGRVLTVRYEDLVTAPERVLRRVLVFLGESWDDSVLRHHEAGVPLPAHESSSAAVTHPVTSQALERWRAELDSAQVAAVEGATGELMAVLGYQS